MEIAAVLIPLCLTGGTALAGLLVVSSAAAHQSRRWQAQKDTYRAVRSEIRQMKHTLQTVTVFEWPIWPRPLLYDAIDRQTQLSFARAEEALVTIRKIDSQLRSVPFHTNGLSVALHIPKNLAIWRNARANRRLLQLLQAQHQVLSECLQQISRNQAEVSRLQQQVKADLARFRQTFSQADLQYLGYFSDPEDPHKVQVTTIHNEINACLSAAEAAVSQPATVDGMGYAAAHFWLQAAVVFQSSFDAACLVQTYSDAYVLDSAQQRLDAILNTLRSLDLNRQSQAWLPMANAHRTILHQKNAYANVLKSISEFEAQHQQMSALKKQLTGANLEELKLQAEKAEAELAEYFAAGLDREFWRGLLQADSPPSVQIQQAQERLRAEIELGAQSKLLQSEITQKIAQEEHFLGQFRSEVEAIGQNVQAVLTAVQLQKEAESQVRQKLGPGGETTRSLQALEGYLDNSPDEIRQKQLHLQADYQQLQTRAAARRGANYADLLAELARFESECSALKNEHAATQAALQAQAAAFNERIRTLRESAARLQNKPPIVTGRWNEIFQQLAGAESQYQAVSGSYERLNAYLQQAPTTIASLNEEIEKINQIHLGFAQAKLNLNNHLSIAKKAVEGQIDSLSFSWPLPMRELLNDFKAFKNEYAGLRKRFLRLSNIVNMPEALLAMDSLEKQMLQVEAQVKEKIDLSIKQQKQLNDFEKQINSTIQNAQYLNISIARVESAREIMLAAREKESFADAYTLLKWAVSILQSKDPATGQATNPNERGQGNMNRPGSNRMITSDYKQDVPPENNRE